jgi:hypothetical protein
MKASTTPRLLIAAMSVLMCAAEQGCCAGADKARDEINKPPPDDCVIPHASWTTKSIGYDVQRSSNVLASLKATAEAKARDLELAGGSAELNLEADLRRIYTEFGRADYLISDPVTRIAEALRELQCAILRDLISREDSKQTLLQLIRSMAGLEVVAVHSDPQDNQAKDAYSSPLSQLVVWGTFEDKRYNVQNWMELKSPIKPDAECGDHEIPSALRPPTAQPPRVLWTSPCRSSADQMTSRSSLRRARPCGSLSATRCRPSETSA